MITEKSYAVEDMKCQDQHEGLLIKGPGDVIITLGFKSAASAQIHQLEKLLRQMNLTTVIVQSGGWR